jgi:multidrug resistance efflux pump
MQLIKRINEIKGWCLILFGFFGFFFIASMIPVVGSVSGEGFIAKKVENVEVIAPKSGLIKEVFVHSGKDVKKNDILFKYEADSFNLNLKGKEAQIKSLKIMGLNLKESLKNKELLIDTISAQLTNDETLVDKNFLSKAYLFDRKKELLRAQNEVYEVQQRLKTNDLQILTLEEERKQVIDQINHLKILAPISGSIMNLTVTSPNTEVFHSKSLLQITSNTDELYVDVKFPVNHLDQLEEGQKVELFFHSIVENEELRMPGKLIYLSKDKIIDDSKSSVYVRGKVDFETSFLREKINLRAGLPVSIIAINKETNLLQYIIRPLKDRLNRGMK